MSRQRDTPGPGHLTVHVVGVAKLPTAYGQFQIVGYRSTIDTEEYVALTIGDLDPGIDTLVRIHSQCLTAESFGSLRCDCSAQLDATLSLMGREGRGAVVYQFQEGRGIGILDKIRAYALQDKGRDTVDANTDLGLEVDLRRYDQCAEILLQLNLLRVRLISNNPAKMKAVQNAGLRIISRVYIELPLAEDAVSYSETKRDRLGHIFGASPRDVAPLAITAEDQIDTEFWSLRLNGNGGVIK